MSLKFVNFKQRECIWQ